MDERDAELLKAAGTGDRRAFETIYARHKDLLYTVACHLLRDQSAAEDVLHDVFVSLARNAGSLQLTKSLSSYLVSSCINRCRDLGRRKGVEPALDPACEAPSECDSPANLAELRDESSRIHGAVSGLPPEQREVLVLRVFGQWKFREIAEQLSISINTAQSRYRYALDSLKRRLAGQGVQS